MIVRQIDEKDRRFRSVELSEKGRKILEEVGDSIQRTENRLFGCLTQEETEQLLKLLEKVAQHAACDKDRRDIC